MKGARLVPAIVWLALCPTLAAAADLTKIDRTIAKEPAYESKPKYCLLVFGSDAKTRIWLVLDGDRLYVDRNGNGDLTDDGEGLVAARKTLSSAGKGRVWQVGDVAASGGKVVYTGLTVSDISDVLDSKFGSRGLGITVKVPIGSARAFQSVGSAVHPAAGYNDKKAPAPNLRFADRPQDAPVIHFGGPLRIMVRHPERFTAGIKAGEKYELEARVGTPGLDKDTPAIIDDTDLGLSVDPDEGTVAELEFVDRDGRKQRQHLKLVCD